MPIILCCQEQLFKRRDRDPGLFLDSDIEEKKHKNTIFDFHITHLTAIDP